MDNIITKEKSDALTLHWLQLAVDASKERYGKKDGYSRPVLSGIHVQNGTAQTADGFRIHQAPAPEPLNDFEGVVRVRGGKTLHKSPGRVYDAEAVEGAYPDTEQIFPRGTPQAVISVNAQYLRDALDMPNDNPGDRVILKVYRSTSPILIERPDGDCRALLMPMHAKEREEEAAEADNRAALLDLLKTRHPDIYRNLKRELE